MERQVGVAIVGIGSISGIYLKNITTVFRELRIAGIYDLLPQRAQKAAEEYGIEKIYGSMQELLGDPAVEIVLNLTRPAEHYQVIRDALLAGKHVYTEKPLAADMHQAGELVALAKEKGLLLGGAPDTFLGAGIQTCRKLIDSDMIGAPIGAAAFMVCHGHESWHPDPEFYYKKGGGPLLDMGPSLPDGAGEPAGRCQIRHRRYGHAVFAAHDHQPAPKRRCDGGGGGYDGGGNAAF